MLNEVLTYLKNYFEVDKLYGDFTIQDGYIKYADGREIPIGNGQYIRVMKSIYNDGVYKHFDDTPMDFTENETFNGAVWRLAIPKDVIATVDEITAWRGKYEQIDSPAMSPYTSESFNGYSYSKNTSNGLEGGSWLDVFASRLKRYRKL